MSESAATFGPGGTLLGIFEDAAGRAQVCCLLINAGVISRVGPNRLNVKIARALRERDVASMRFDLSGIGDSKASAGAASFHEQSAQDIRAAMDFVQQVSGIRRFVIFGICSGAVNAFRGGLSDARIEGVLMLDGFWYRTRWSEPIRLWKRLRRKSFAEILEAVRRRLRRSATPPAGGDAGLGPVDLFAVNGNPPREEFARDLNAITARGVDVFFLYTGSVPQQVSYAGQLRDAFRGEAFVERVRCELHEDLDHTAVPLRAQRKLLGMIGDWIDDVARKRAPTGGAAHS